MVLADLMSYADFDAFAAPEASHAQMAFHHGRRSMCGYIIDQIDTTKHDATRVLDTRRSIEQQYPSAIRR